MKKISGILSALTILCLLGAMSAGVSAADYPVFYVGDTVVTATEEGTSYWIEDESASPASEFTATGASAENYDFSLVYDETNGYMLTANGLDIETYATYNDGSTTYRGGIICLSDLAIVVGTGGLSITETAGGVNGIYTSGTLNVTGTGSLTVDSEYTAINNQITCDVDGAVSLFSLDAPTVTNAVTITAGDDINITNTNSLAVTGAADLTSENGGVTINVSGGAPVIGASLTVDAYDDVILESSNGGIIVSGASDITSQNGVITANSNGVAPAFLGTTTMMAKGAISIYNRNYSAFASSADLTSEEGSILVKGGNASTSANLISNNATLEAYGNITVENTGRGLAVGGAADLTSLNGSITVTSKSDGPTVGGVATIAAKDDIIVTNENHMAFNTIANLTSTLGNITVTGNIAGAPILSGLATMQAKGNISILNQGTGYVGGNSLDLTSTDGTVTAICNSTAPLVSGYIHVAAKGDVSLENQGNGTISTNYADITSTAGAVNVASATTTAPAIGSPAEITAYGDITVTATAVGGFCMSGTADLKSEHGNIDLLGNSSNPIICGVATLKAANDISVVNQGTGSALCNPTTLESTDGNIDVASAGFQAANAMVKVNLGSLDKTATFTSLMAEAVPVGFTTDMLAYRVYGGADADHLVAISLADATDYYCVQFELAFAVTAGSTNFGNFADDGFGNYTITSADTLTYEQGGASTAGAYLGVYFNGLSGTNGTDYYLSYGDNDSVNWDENKAITVNEGESDPSLYVNLVNGEKTLYVYFDPDADGTEFTGSVLSVQYQIPDDATYNDSTDEYTWNGSAWIKNASVHFNDISTGSWYYEDVQYVYSKGLMIGTDEDSFTPNGLLTRSALVLMLWRMEGKPAATVAASFDDVNEDAYYADAVAWAAGINIIAGYGQNKFGPGDVITREQFATILYRYAVYKEYNVGGSADLSGFTDAGQISDYALIAMQWANVKGIIKGTSATTLSPQGCATRAQAAAMLHRFMVAFVEEV